MSKKRAAKSKATTKAAKPKSASRTTRAKKHATSAEVRSDIAKMVNSGAKKITKAVMDQAMTGQLAPAKYLFEVAGVYPPLTDGSEATTDEDCFAKTLLDRLNIPTRPIALDEEDDSDRTSNPAPGTAFEQQEGGKLPNQSAGEQRSSASSKVDDEGEEVPVPA